jgi:nitroimidazol reductase NimA-like FMN-containing flavoprotein (pyridoxamine 5'-phosphate oxidase superfamily)
VTTTERADEVLEEKECLRLLGAAGIGRVAYTEGALPRIRPVSYAMRDHVVVIPTRAEDPLAPMPFG